MSFDDIFGPPPKKVKGGRKKSSDQGIFGEQGNQSIESMFLNLKANAEAARSSPAGSFIEGKIRKHQRTKGIKKAKRKIFQDTIRTKRMKKRKFTTLEKDHFVF